MTDSTSSRETRGRRLVTSVRNLLRRKFVVDSLYLNAAAVGSHGLGFVTVLVLASVLGAAQFGLYSLSFAVFGILLSLLQPPFLNTAVVLFAEARSQNRVDEARGALSFFLKAQVAFSLLLLGVGALLSGLLASLVFEKNLEPLLVVALLLHHGIGTFYHFANLFFLGLRAMRAHSALILVDALVRSSLIIGAVVGGYGVEGAIWAHVLASLLASGYGFSAYRIYAKRNQPAYASISGILREGRFLKDCRKHFRVNLTYHLNRGMGSLCDSLPTALVSYFAGLEATGHFAMALKVATLPGMLAAPLSTNTRSRLPEAKAQGFDALRQTYRRISKFSVLTIGGLSALLVPTGLIFFLWFSGGSYMPAFSTYLIILLASATLTYSMPQGPFLLTIQRLDIALRWAALSLISFLAVSFWLGPGLAGVGIALGILAQKVFFVFPVSIEINRLLEGWARQGVPRSSTVPSP